MIQRLIKAVLMLPVIYFAYLVINIAFIAVGGEPQGKATDALFPICFGWIIYAVIAKPILDRYNEKESNR